MKKINDWQTFWEGYRNVEFVSESDLFFQVGKTLNGRAVNDSILRAMIDDIVESLELSSSDLLVELCCGNGLMTFALRSSAKEIFAFDFTSRLIKTAERVHHSSNITFKVADANENFFKIFDFSRIPNKYLMNDSLGYFTPQQLKVIIRRIVECKNNFRFYITGIPNAEKKEIFYNTDERMNQYLRECENGDFTHQGIGHWWNINKIHQIAESLDVNCIVRDYPLPIFSYRSNVLIWR